MKKFVFGCVLMLSGIIGGTGWLIAHALIIVSEPSAFYIFLGTGARRIDGYIVMIFYIIAIIGAVLSANNLNEDK